MNGLSGILSEIKINLIGQTLTIGQLTAVVAELTNLVNSDISVDLDTPIVINKNCQSWSFDFDVILETIPLLPDLKS